ncbi:MAG: tetratricopeptide repeat protein [Candidatus Cloacimonetes bacterium]|nr:tetratricopeptide repeat protein [Candidatus Cloacimonadota bacterium]
MKTKLLILFLLVFVSFLSAELVNYDKVIRNSKGQRYYDKKSYQQAGDTFKKNALEYPKDPRLHFNQANAQVKNDLLEEAEQNYNLALSNNSFNERSEALQNLGNVKFKQKDYKNAIKYYRDSLIEDPENADARHNYELTARMLQKQQQQKQESDQNKDNDDKDQENDQKNKPGDQQEEKQKQEEKKQQTQEQKMKEQKKEDADKMLKALLQKEKEEMKKQKQKMNIDRSKTGKYW